MARDRKRGDGFAELVRFEGMRRVLWRPQPVAVALYVVFVAMAHAIGSTGWIDDAGIGLLVFTLCAGFGVDRELAYDQLVLSNWVSPWPYVGAKLVSLALALLATAGIVGITVLAASSGAWPEARWHALVYLLVAAYSLPLVLLAELEMETRLPMVAVVAGFAVAGGILAWLVGSEVALGWIVGAPPIQYRVETLQPLARRALGVSMPASFVVLVLIRRRIAGPAR